MSEVKPERTGWRDEGISRRHRMWGVACAATDIDFLLVESNGCTPAALIEYKNEFAPLQYASDYQYRVLKSLGDSASIPVFAVRYKSDFSTFKVIPINEHAKHYILDRQLMVEKDFVKLLYKIREKDVPEEVLKNIGVTI